MKCVLAEIRDHVQRRTGGTYLRLKEMNLMCSSIVKEYPSLADPDSQSKGFVRHKT